MKNREFKRTLKSLLKKYKREISEGNNEHVTDLIATMVLLDLSYFDVSTSMAQKMDIDITSLKTLMYWGMQTDELAKSVFVDRKDNNFVVPTVKELNLLKMNYEKELKDAYISIPEKALNENAIATWIEMMIKFGMIKEGQTINLDKIRLADFMTDPKLASMYDTNVTSIRNYTVSSK